MPKQGELGLGPLRELADNCPACINAGVMRLCLLPDAPLLEFDFFGEREAMWARREGRRLRADG